MLFLVVISFSSFRRSTFQKFSDFLRDAFVAVPAESKPKRRMTSTKTIGVRLMGGKLPGRRWRAECRTGDLEQRTRRKCSSRRWLDSSSRYFLKRSKIDISQNVKFLSKRNVVTRIWLPGPD